MYEIREGRLNSREIIRWLISEFDAGVTLMKINQRDNEFPRGFAWMAILLTNINAEASFLINQFRADAASADINLSAKFPK